MKKIGLLLVILTICGISIACKSKGIDDAEIDFGTSDVYDEKYVESAANVILDYSGNGFTDCELIKLAYSEEETVNRQASESKEVIIFYTDFNTGNNVEALNPNSDYTYEWVLKRKNQTNDWEISEFGQG